MKINIVIITFLFTIGSYSQTLKNDWENFKVKNWKVEAEKGFKFLGRELQGQIHFKNINDSNKKVTYYVFLRSEKNYELEKELLNYYYIQSCIYEDAKVLQFGSFNKGKYFYALKPCYQFNLKNEEECRKLATEIFSFSDK
ncbi:hypothetical protein [Flavobacterium sp. RSSB_23]|uniref:hypothetical protein n=1 Tax=Flavobacterium sp. RSSB_23 TaxID=3447668 RepID=UPI003F2EACCF